MAVTNGTFGVTAAAQALTAAGNTRGANEVTIDNSSANEIAVGGAGVTTANGIRIAAGASKTFLVRGNDQLYVIAGSASTIRYMVAPLLLS
jgi:hypothetical protein